jgi:hypothetical protein
MNNYFFGKKKFGGISYSLKTSAEKQLFSLGTEILTGLNTPDYGLNILYTCMYDNNKASMKTF